MHIVKASLLNIVGRVVSILSTFVSVFFLGRMFGATDFGYWAWLFSLFSLVTAQDFGFITSMRVRMGQAIVSDEVLEQKLLFAVSFLLSILIGLYILATAAIYLGATSFKACDILLVLGCSLTTVLGYCAAQGSVAYLQSGWIGISESLRGALQISVIICANAFELNFDVTLVLFYICTALYTPFVTLVFLKSRNWHLAELFSTLGNDLKISLQVAKSLLKEGSYLWLMQICLALLTLSDVFIAGFLVSDGDVAVVNAIMRLVLLAVGFVMASMTPVMGHFVAKLKSLNQDIFWERFSKAALFLLVTGCAYGIFLYYFGSKIILLWANLVVAPSYVFILSGLFFSSIGMLILLQTFLQMPMLTRAILPLLIIAGIFKILLPFGTVPVMGYGGVILSGMLVNFVFVLIAVMLIFQRGYLKKFCLDHPLK